MRKSFWLLICCLLLAVLLASGCAPSTRKIMTNEYPRYVSSGLQSTNLENISSPSNKCQVQTVALISSWVTAGSPEKDPFDFTSVDGKACQGNFENDVQPLFTTPNLWYAGALSCRTCHGPDVKVSYMGLNLSSYQGIKAGANGQDILGGGNWQTSKLSAILSSGVMPPAKPANYDVNGPIVFAGMPK